MLKFSKYVAAGNDFIIVDDWEEQIKLDREQIMSLCDRKFGIGADGLMLLTPNDQADFRMNYFNADGSRGEMCGNGARSLVHFAAGRGKTNSQGRFLADDGFHEYIFQQDQIVVEIIVPGDLREWDIPFEGCAFINTGVPHLVIPSMDIEATDLEPLGQGMNSHAAHPQGCNVNIIEPHTGKVLIRTWERGVNTETLACGTGAVAAGIFAHQEWGLRWPIELIFKGGVLSVDQQAKQYWLGGPAELVFSGQIELS